MNYNTGTLLEIQMPVTGLILNRLPYRPTIYMEQKKMAQTVFQPQYKSFVISVSEHSKETEEKRVACDSNVQQLHCRDFDVIVLPVTVRETCQH